MTVGELSNRSAKAAITSRDGPIIVMSYVGSGIDQLQSMLSGFPELACTQQTGILPLFHRAVTTWQAVDGGAGEGVSPLAAASLRALSAGLMTAIFARQGGKRWCEFASAPIPAAQAFARLHPQARFLIAHRRADTVVRAIIGASRWGLEGPEFVPFVSARPASPVAALMDYWATHTAQQLEFEQANPGACLRFRVEDLTAGPSRTLLAISRFLALDGDDLPPSFTDDDDRSRPAEGVAPPTGLPLDRIPPSLLERVNELHRSLDYPPVTAARV